MARRWWQAQGLEAHDVLMLNRELLKGAKTLDGRGVHDPNGETDGDHPRDLARARQAIKSGFFQEKKRSRHKVDLLDLLNAGVLSGRG